VLLALALLACACGDRAGEEARAPSPVEAIAGPSEGIPSWARVAPEQVAAAAEHGVPVAFENDLGMRFVLIPAGTFVPRSAPDEPWRRDDETPREVTIGEPYYVGITEVTNAQYRAFDADHVSLGLSGAKIDLDGETQPVSGVTRDDAERFAAWLSRRDGGVRAYRLPTEEEWEHACQGGRSTRFFFGDDEADLRKYANTAEVAAIQLLEGRAGPDGHASAAPVGSYLPNGWGLYDTLGNVRELCDGPFFAPLESQMHSEFRDLIPPPPPLPDWAPARGGSWIDILATDDAPIPDCATRTPANPHAATLDSIDLGFRLVSPLPVPEER